MKHYEKLFDKPHVKVRKRRRCCCIATIFTMSVLAVAVLILGLNAAGVFAIPPLHAQCSVTWHFGVPCQEVATKIQKQIQIWTSADNCAKGGEKCLYKFKSFDGKVLKATHETPKSHYVDDLTFTFLSPSTQKTCDVKGYSRSETWYAVLDYGTNYCNLRNLLDGAGLSGGPDFREETSNSICTQYSSHDCEKY